MCARTAAVFNFCFLRPPSFLFAKLFGLFALGHRPYAHHHFFRFSLLFFMLLVFSDTKNQVQPHDACNHAQKRISSTARIRTFTYFSRISDTGHLNENQSKRMFWRSQRIIATFHAICSVSSLWVLQLAQSGPIAILHLEGARRADFGVYAWSFAE